MKKKKRFAPKRTRLCALFLACFLICFSVGVYALSVNAVVLESTDSAILSPKQASETEDVDCILVLGCLVKANGVPSDMLYDRVRMGAELYLSGVADKLLVSGDHGREDYNEVAAMRDTAMQLGVLSEDIFMDHAGFDTYDSVYRAAEIFGAERIVIVSQGYHLHRALYIAKSLGMEAYGVAADYRTYWGQVGREVREILARNKDVFSCLFGASPKYLGDAISLDGNGEITKD